MQQTYSIKQKMENNKNKIKTQYLLEIKIQEAKTLSKIIYNISGYHQTMCKNTKETIYNICGHHKKYGCIILVIHVQDILHTVTFVLHKLFYTLFSVFTLILFANIRHMCHAILNCQQKLQSCTNIPSYIRIILVKTFLCVKK